MGSILVTMPRYEDARRIANLLKESGIYLDVEICTTGAETLRTMHDRDYGVIICPKRLKDMSYTELADYLPDFFGMIVLTKDASLDSASDKMVKLILPLKMRELRATVEMMTNDFYARIRKRKKGPPKRSAKDQKIINDAKAMLMERNGMSEPEAFRYIQKNSMDYGRTMVESAQMMLLMGGD